MAAKCYIYSYETNLCSIAFFDLTFACSFEKKPENNQKVISLQPASKPVVRAAPQPVVNLTEKVVLQDTLDVKKSLKHESVNGPARGTKPSGVKKKIPEAPGKLVNKGVITNTANLNKNLQAATSGDLLMKKAVDKAITDGYKALKKPIAVITTKSFMVDTEDKHNFNSVAPYWHQQDNGTWKRIDGKANGLSGKIGDTVKLQKGVGSVVPTLALAYVASSNPAEKEKFAARAIEYCQKFFLNPATRMNPNLDYAQLIPGQNKIRVESAVEGEKLVEIVDALLLLQSSKHYTPEFDRQIRSWFGDMADWMVNSPTGKQADKKIRGNIGVIYETMRAAFAIFSGDTSYARRRLPRVKERLFAEMDSDGGLKLELGRAKPNMYSNKALNAWLTLARIMAIQDVDLWTLEENGKSLEKAVLFMVPYMMGEKKLNDTEEVQPRYFKEVARTAQYAYRNHPATVQALEQFLVKYDTDFREGDDPAILTESYLPWMKGLPQPEFSSFQEQ
ncbi:alginate lyase family protein [Adhaeribacter pallidiroseus]|nr:alginate lyase family protein [Adhaeribacter pallidiroseus]